MSKIIALRKPELQKAIEEVANISPACWVVIGINNEDDKIRVIGPEKFDLVTMLGMLEYAKHCVEPQDEPTKRA